jgi:hypothetical protein
MLLTQDHFNAALSRQNHAKLLKGCTLEELVSIKVPASYRDPLFTQQQQPSLFKKLTDKKPKLARQEISGYRTQSSRPVSRNLTRRSPSPTLLRPTQERTSETAHLIGEGGALKASKYPTVELSHNLNEHFIKAKALDQLEKSLAKRGKPLAKPVKVALSPIKPVSETSDIAQIKRMKDRCHMCDKLTCVCVVEISDDYLTHMHSLFMQSRIKSRQTEDKLKPRPSKRSSPHRLQRLKLPAKDSDLVLFSLPQTTGGVKSNDSLISGPVRRSAVKSPRVNHLLLPEIAVQQTLLALPKEKSSSRFSPRTSRVLKAKPTKTDEIPAKSQIDEVVVVTSLKKA